MSWYSFLSNVFMSSCFVLSLCCVAVSLCAGRAPTAPLCATVQSSHSFRSNGFGLDSLSKDRYNGACGARDCLISPSPELGIFTPVFSLQVRSIREDCRGHQTVQSSRMVAKRSRGVGNDAYASSLAAHSFKASFQIPLTFATSVGLGATLPTAVSATWSVYSTSHQSRVSSLRVPRYGPPQLRSRRGLLRGYISVGLSMEFEVSMDVRM